MNLTLFEAGKGDSFLLSWGIENENHILIDGGIPNTYKSIHKKLKETKSLKAIIITHVDYDHIGGILNLLKDDERKISLDFPFFVNTPNLILTIENNDKVHYQHGSILSELLTNLKIIPKSILLGEYEKNEVEIDGLILKILSPNKLILETLLREWKADDILKEYEKESKINGMVSSETIDLKSIPEIISEKESLKKWQSDLINSSSISFLATFNNKNILFLADSNPLIICKELVEIGYSESNPLIVDVVKLSHHGCLHNTSISLLKLIKSNKFIISTNGNGPYHHPHRETIVKIAKYCRRKNINEKIEFITNYELNTHKFITKNEIEDLNIFFKKTNELPI